MARRPRKRVALKPPAKRPARRGRPDPTVALPPRRTLQNLPVLLTSFIGREVEIADLRRRLDTSRQRLDATRLLTLTGSGGCGKTRLALEVVAGLLPQYPDGIWFVDLAALSDPSLVPQAVAAAVGLSDRSGRPMQDVLRDYLQTRNVLLIMDNCEHVIVACASLAEMLLKTCPTLRVLATSREPLRVDGETTWRIPPLAVPEPGPLPSLDELARFTAVALFLDRAGTVMLTFALTADNAEPIVDICRCLDGMPLAVELAAARVTVMTPRQIAAGLSDRFRLLVAGSRSAQSRQQTMRAVIDWSYTLLSAPEQAVLRRFAVFAGGAVREAAEAVCGAKGVSPDEVFDLLTQLVNKSLVDADVRQDVARYRLLETTRQYCLEQLEQAGELSSASRRHCGWYVRLAEDADLFAAGPDLPARLARLEVEHDNFRAALGGHGLGRDAASDRARIACALLQLWFLRGHWAEGRRWFALMLDQRRDVVQSMHPKLLYSAAHLASSVDPDAASQLSREGLAAEREIGDAWAQSRLIFIKALCLRGLYKYAEAEAALEEATGIARMHRDAWLIVVGTGNLARCRLEDGDRDRAKTLGEQSLAEAREAGDPSLIGWTLAFQGLQAVVGGRYDAAAQFYREGLGYAATIKDTFTTGDCLLRLVSVAHACGDDAAAARLLGAGDVNYQDTGRTLQHLNRRDRDRDADAVRAALGVSAFEKAYAEGRAMTPEQAVEYAMNVARAFASASSAHKRGQDASLLTPRERTVATLIVEGLSNRNIAGRIGIKESTAEAHVQHILNKLGVHTRAQIAVWAHQHGLTSPA